MSNIASIYPQSPAPVRGTCTGCGLLLWCLPANLSSREYAQLDAVMEHRRFLKRDSALFLAGDTLDSLYIVNSGSVKTLIADVEGRAQVTGFSMPGDLVGIEAIDSGRYPCDVITLEDSSCCGISYENLRRLSQNIPALQLHVHRMMSREITRDYGLMFLLGSMGAEERIAQFVLTLSTRYAARGYSASQFRLCMSRNDIGSYLGLRLETVSRILGRLNNRDILEIIGRDIHLKNPDGLRQILCGFESRISQRRITH